MFVRQGKKLINLDMCTKAEACKDRLEFTNPSEYHAYETMRFESPELANGVFDKMCEAASNDVAVFDADLAARELAGKGGAL